MIAIENVRLFQELKESLEQQTATSEVLRVIASSPTDIQPVLNTVAEHAARVCGAVDAGILRFDGGKLWHVAQYGPIPAPGPLGSEVMCTRGVVHGRALIDRQTIHVPDIAAQVETEFPDAKELQEITGTRTILATPLLREGASIGVIVNRRTEVLPFSEKHIRLLETFADQAVIAIENVRLFNELKEALEQQTATSEILRVIASSPTDIQPVLEKVAATAAGLCDATDVQIRLVDGDGTRLVASFGTHPAPEYVAHGQKTPGTRAFIERRPVHVQDLRAELGEYTDSQKLINQTGTRTFLCVPMLREGSPIGLISIRRTDVRPFSDKQIKLLETFAARWMGFCERPCLVRGKY